MTKNELIRLIKCGIEISNEWQLEEALKIKSEMLKIFFQTSVDKKIAYLFIDVCEDVDKYKYVLECLARVNNEKVQREFLPLYSRLRDVPFNDYFKTVMSTAVFIPTVKLLDSYMNFVPDKKVFSLTKEDQLLFVKTIMESSNSQLRYNLATIYNSDYGRNNEVVNKIFVDSLNLKLQDFSRMINLIAKNIEYELHLPMLNSISDILSNYSSMSSKKLDKELSQLEKQLELSYEEKTISLHSIIKKCPEKLLEVLEQLDSNKELSLDTKIKVKTLNRK